MASSPFDPKREPHRVIALIDNVPVVYFRNGNPLVTSPCRPRPLLRFTSSGSTEVLPLPRAGAQPVFAATPGMPHVAGSAMQAPALSLHRSSSAGGGVKRARSDDDVEVRLPSPLTFDIFAFLMLSAQNGKWFLLGPPS